jgi:hypothetical protein
MRAMIEYRAYTVGLDGHFIGLKEFVCADDSEAIKMAKHLIDGHNVELWCGVIALLSRLFTSPNFALSPAGPGRPADKVATPAVLLLFAFDFDRALDIFGG